MGRTGEQFDTSWARTPAAGVAREIIVNYTLGPLIDHYTKPITLGAELFGTLPPPVVFVANHSSHLDTPTAALASTHGHHRGGRLLLSESHHRGARHLVVRHGAHRT
jgi:hypothetical protein